MSICVNIRTKKELPPKAIFDAFVKRGESIMVESPELPCLKFGTIEKALRGIEINQEEDGYEVRVCSFANRADLELYSTALEVLMQLTKGRAYLENEDESEVKNPLDEFGKEWIDRELESSLNVSCALTRCYGQTIVMYGLFHPFCFGPVLAHSFGIDLSGPSIEKMTELQEYLARMQWTLVDKKNTSSRLAIANPNNEDDEPLSISLIVAKNKHVEDFEFISYASVVCFMDEEEEGNDIVMIHIDDLKNVLPSDMFFMVDDYQFVKDGKLTYKKFKEIQQRARLYQVEDLHYRPTFPGTGYDERQKTYVLMWNPDISNVKLENHASHIPSFMVEHFSWSVYEHEEVKKNDRFVMVRCGEGKTGLVMSGIFDSNPCKGDDWSDKGREVYYMELRPNFIADSERAQIITTEELQKAIPDFDWTGGHSGRLLKEEQAKKLDLLIREYSERVVDKIDGRSSNGFDPFLVSHIDYERDDDDTEQKEVSSNRQKRLDLDLIFGESDDVIIVLKNGKGEEVVDEHGEPITAKYVGGGKFDCRGEIARASPLAKKYLNLYGGMNLNTVNGNEYWYYKGQKLQDLRKN